MVGREEAETRLRTAGWLQNPALQRIFKALDGGAGRTRAVGGVVRDTLMAHDRTSTDFDLATELSPDQVVKRAHAAGIASYPTGIEHGTVTLKANDLVAEVTTLREDVETDGRHAVVRFGTDWSRDAQRRDFTLNALYCEADGTLFDPLDGLDDCLSARIRFIGSPEQRIAEDRLRVFRFFRFSASHGHQRFDPAGLDACREASNTLGNLSAERVGSEMARIIALSKVSRTLHTMADAGVVYFTDEQLRQLESYEDLAPYPTGRGRLALLVTDGTAEALQARWRLSNEMIADALAVLRAARLVNLGALNEAAYRFPRQIETAIPVAAAIAERNAEEVAQNFQRLNALAIPKFPLSGADLLARGFAPGRAVGLELNRLERIWIDSGFSLGRDELIGRIEG
ncbi:CCA tRNA nucleotidyltransferase [Devosia sp. D6-9]|nr:CCA tRNA nucleotidyltransferase [Devosia sp. D6-9]